MGIKNEYIVILDIGTITVRSLVIQLVDDNNKLRIIGVGEAQSKGMRRGAIVDLEEATKPIQKSLEEAQLSSGVEINSVYVSVGGIHLNSIPTKGVVAVGRADSEVSAEDVQRVMGAAEAVNLPANFEILYLVPQAFKLDDQEGIKDPVGMNGVRLEMEALAIYTASSHLRNLEKCLERLDLEIDGFIATPLAAAKAVLNKRQKELGTVMIDLGGGTTSLAVYEEQELIHLAILPVGSNHITNDIAIGLRTSIDVAEKVKIKYGSALPKEISKKDEINLANFDEAEEGIVSRHHVAEIIEARLDEIFSLAEKELKKINRSALLPAGAILCGGGACLNGAVDLAKKNMQLPAQMGFPKELTGLVDKVGSPTFAVAVGMALWVMEDAEEIAKTAVVKQGGFSGKVSSMRDSVKTVRQWVGRFLP